MKIGNMLIWVWVLVVTVSAADASQLEKRALLDGRVEMLVPSHFKPMTDAMLRLKYPNQRRPTFVLTDKRGAFNVAFNHTAHAMDADKRVAYHGNFEKMFRNRYPSATWYRSELTAINGSDVFILELLTPAIDTQIHNIILVTALDHRMLLVSVNITRELRDKWLASARKMIESITIRQ